MLRTTWAKLPLIDTACRRRRSGHDALTNSPCLRHAEAPYTADGSTDCQCQSCSAAFIALRLKIQKTSPTPSSGTTYHTLRHSPRANTSACSPVVIGIRKATMHAE